MLIECHLSLSCTINGIRNLFCMYEEKIAFDFFVIVGHVFDLVCSFDSNEYAGTVSVIDI